MGDIGTTLNKGFKNFKPISSLHSNFFFYIMTKNFSVLVGSDFPGIVMFHSVKPSK